MTLGSVFSGIGGLDLGLERAGFEVKWQIENNPFCQRVLAKHWPDVKRYGEIATVTGHELAPVDIICGGVPCQPFSATGQRKGVNDDKGRWLWPEFKRLVGVLRPRLIFVENVPGLLTVNDGYAFGDILGDLAELGYDAEWSMLSAADVGAPHIRKRIFIIGTNQDVADATINQEGSHRPRSHPAGGAIRETTGIGSSARHRLGNSGGFWTARPQICGVSHGTAAELGEVGEFWTHPYEGLLVSQGVPNRAKQLAALGNAVVPQCAEHIGRLILNGTIPGGR
jgi:DNA (cytosine-5)-methyltransferase 1